MSASAGMATPSLVPSGRTEATRVQHVNRDWHWRIETTVAGETLLLAWRGRDEIRDVRVLLDGRAPGDHPAIYARTPFPQTLRAGDVLRYAYVLPRGARPFRTIRIRWTDEAGVDHDAEFALAPRRRAP